MVGEKKKKNKHIFSIFIYNWLHFCLAHFMTKETKQNTDLEF